MTQTQLNRFSVISSVIQGKTLIKEAALSLGLSERQVKRLKKGVIKEGPAFLFHKNSGRKPKHALTSELKEKIVKLKKSAIYENANFLHFKELLAEHEGIVLSYSCLHALLTEAGIKSPKKRRKVKPHHRRKRKPQEGLLIQMDASPFEWFSSAEKFALHGAIDDATGKIVGLYLAKHECLQGYFEVTRQILTNFGIPASIYADKHSIFISPNASKLTLEDQLNGKVVNDTQFGRALKELGINLIPAHSAPAKGRIERLWETLQSRLPVEFNIAGVSTVDQANAFLSQYLPKFNEMFFVEAQNPNTAYRPLTDDLDLSHILCVKHQRSVDNGGVFSFRNKLFKLVDGDIVPPRAKVDVLVSPSFGIKVSYKDFVFDTLPFVKPKRGSQSKSELPQADKKAPYVPPDSHYYKYGHSLVKKVSFEDSDSDILKMLEEIFL